MKDQKGITLVALILMIVIIVVLAGISVTLVLKNETEKNKANQTVPQNTQNEVYRYDTTAVDENFEDEDTFFDEVDENNIVSTTSEGEEIEISGEGRVIENSEKDTDTVSNGAALTVSNTVGNYVVENLDMNTIPSSGANTTSSYSPTAQ